MNLKQLKQAGFSDTEIKEYASSQSGVLAKAGFSAQEITEHFNPKKEGHWEGWIKPSIKSAPRVAGAALGAAAAFPVSGLMGYAKHLTSGPEEAVKTIEQVSNIPMKLLKTPEQEKAIETIFKPFEWLKNASTFYGDAVLKHTGSGNLAATTATAFETAALFGLPKLKAKLIKEVKLRNKVAIQNAIKEIHRERLRVLKEEPKRFEALAKKEALLKKADESVRLYRAESPTVKFEDVFNVEELTKFKPPEGVEGKFYTSDEAYADYFRESYGKDAVVKQIDIPIKDAKKHEVRPGEYFVPDTILSMLGTEHVYQEIAKTTPHIKEFGKSVQDFFSVEAPFKRVDAPDTGRAVKGMFSTRAMHEDFALDFAKEIVGKVKFDKAKSADIALLAEQKNPKLSPELQEPVNAVKQHFQEYKNQYAKYGVDIDFRRRVISEIEAQIANAKPSELAELKKSLTDAKKIDFVHIPSAMWFTDYIGKDPAGGRSILKLLVSQKRKTLSIQDLIKRGVIKKQDVNIVDILASYGRRAGKDLSLLEIISKAKKEGLAVKGKAEGFVDAPYTAPILKGHTLHPVLSDLIFDMTRPGAGGMNLWAKGMSITKMTQFYNPLFLPMYDLVQAGMIGTINPLRPFKTLKYIKEGVGDAWHKTPEYWEAQSNYIASKPFNNPLTSYNRMIENAKKSTVGMVGHRALESITPKGILTGKALQNVYNASWHLAWELDKTVRQISYRALKGKGYTPKEAARLSALAHSDYASVPAKTRKFLNNIFFTPTFKITMGKFYGNMIANATKGATKIPLDTLRLIAGKEKTARMTPTQKRLAMGLVATVAINQGWEFFMESQGFKRDEWGRRYVKKVQTPEGEKEIVVTWSTPANMFLKYISRAKAALQPEVQKPLVRFFEMNKWEIHPLYRVGYEIANNSTGKGDQVYKEFDHPLTKAKKSSIYAITHIVALLGMMDRDESDKEARRMFARESGQLLELATRPITFKYMRTPEEKRKAYKMRSIMMQFRKQLWKDRRNKDIDPNQYEIFKKLIEEVQ